MIEIGKKLPSATLYKLGEKGIDEVDSLEYVSGKKVVLVGVPGAFTPTCSLQQMPGFVEKADEIMDKNVDEIICISVTNPFVMKAWGESLSVGEKITMLADGNGNFTEACELNLDLSSLGIGHVSSRYAVIIEDGIVTSLLAEEGGAFSVSSAENILEQL
ncbi:peroxiredoxin [SAR86 cluster bacterium]|nr:peroxiredoxin [SAR86 cluster bacterium]